MFLDIPIIADVLTLVKLRQARIDERLMKANKKRKLHEFKVNDKAHVHNRNDPADKMKQMWSGPFSIARVKTRAFQKKKNMVCLVSERVD